MEDLIKTFYIDWKLLIAQAVNFVIVLSILGVYALKPLEKLMKERQDKIKKGLSDAEKIEEKMKQIEKNREDEVKKGRKEAQTIIVKAQKQGEEQRRERLEKAQKEVEKVISDARSQISAERVLMVKEVKDELGGLIALGLDKISGETIDEKVHKKLIEQTIKELKETDIN